VHLLQVRENVRVVTSEVNVVELNIDGVLDPFHAPSAMCNRWRSLLGFGERPDVVGLLQSLEVNPMPWAQGRTQRTVRQRPFCASPTFL